MHNIKSTLLDGNLQASETSVQRWEINDGISWAIFWVMFSIKKVRASCYCCLQVYILAILMHSSISIIYRIVNMFSNRNLKSQLNFKLSKYYSGLGLVKKRFRNIVLSPRFGVYITIIFKNL